MTPSLTQAFSVLNHLANELGYNPPGSDEGYLFWAAWYFHNLNSVVSTEDAHGAVIRGYQIVNCDQLTQQPPVTQQLLAAVALLPNCQ